MMKFFSLFGLWLAENPGVIMALSGLVIWPTITAVSSFAQEAIQSRWPLLWDRMQAAGFDLNGFLRSLRKVPPPDVRALPATVAASPYRSLIAEPPDETEDERVARIYYETYRRTAGVNYAGLPIPGWEELPRVAQLGHAAGVRAVLAHHKGMRS